jgi:hypothetical protein
MRYEARVEPGSRGTSHGSVAAAEAETRRHRQGTPQGRPDPEDPRRGPRCASRAGGRSRARTTSPLGIRSPRDHRGAACREEDTSIAFLPARSLPGRGDAVYARNVRASVDPMQPPRPHPCLRAASPSRLPCSSASRGSGCWSARTPTSPSTRARSRSSTTVPSYRPWRRAPTSGRAGCGRGRIVLRVENRSGDSSPVDWGFWTAIEFR